MEQRHPIKVAVKRTGLSPHVIRVWERRYKAVNPVRTETNRRLYSDDDIERLTLLHKATLAGESIGQIAGLTMAQLKALVKTDQDDISRRVGEGLGQNADEELTADYFLERAIRAIEKLDPRELETTLLQASMAFGCPMLMEAVLEPLMYRIGDLWRDGDFKIVHEHLASAVVRSFLGGMVGAYALSDSAPRLIAATPSGQLHEFGALMAVITAASDGWQPVYLGPSVPAEDIAEAARRHRAQAVVLSIIYPADDPLIDREIRKLATLLGSETRLILGGRASNGYRNIISTVGATHIAELSELRRELEAVRNHNNDKKQAG